METYVIYYLFCKLHSPPFRMFRSIYTNSIYVVYEYMLGASAGITQQEDEEGQPMDSVSPFAVKIDSVLIMRKVKTHTTG